MLGTLERAHFGLFFWRTSDAKKDIKKGKGAKLGHQGTLGIFRKVNVYTICED
jgi:hypothetical protein